MKLLENLGLLEYGTKGKRMTYGIYECPVCGNGFKAVSSRIQKGIIKQCRSCADRSKVDKARKTFNEKASKVHNNRYDYSLVDYINASSNVEILCKEHGSFWQTPHNHLREAGCPSCSMTGFDKTKPAILYYLKINGGQAYKIGITNKTVKERFNNSELQLIEIVKTWYFSDGTDAYNEEQRILKEFKEFKYIGADILASGNTELFTKDVLALDV